METKQFPIVWSIMELGRRVSICSLVLSWVYGFFRKSLSRAENGNLFHLAKILCWRVFLGTVWLRLCRIFMESLCSQGSSGFLRTGADSSCYFPILGFSCVHLCTHGDRPGQRGGSCDMKQGILSKDTYSATRLLAGFLICHTAQHYWVIVRMSPSVSYTPRMNAR